MHQHHGERERAWTSWCLWSRRRLVSVLVCLPALCAEPSIALTYMDMEKEQKAHHERMLLNSKQTRAQNQSFSCPTEEKQRRRPVFPFGRALLLGPLFVAEVFPTISYIHSVIIDQVRI